MPARCGQRNPLDIFKGIPPGGILRTDSGAECPFRLAPEPFTLPEGPASRLAYQGILWLKFLRTAQSIYMKSVRGEAPGFVAEYLDMGKPARIMDFGRMNRFRNRFPPLIRPDLLLTDRGFEACELDSIPGGFGLLACLAGIYAREGCAVAGGADGIQRGFLASLKAETGLDNPAVAIAVSEESGMYRPEMDWLAQAMRESGAKIWAASPGELSMRGEGVWLDRPGGPYRLDIVYRFFELFDLANVPNGEALLEAAKLKQVRLTPPPKAHLEEKILLALLHHPALGKLWEEGMGEREFGELKQVVIPTFVLDPRPVPPHAVIAGLLAGGRQVSAWGELARLSQKERGFVVKPSGFSINAWGSHGVRFGPDLSQADWTAAIREALDAFPSGPCVLQPFRRPVLNNTSWIDPADGTIRTMEGRMRVCPYYAVTGEDSTCLAGILVTVCPADKKAVHGMPDAVMGPAGEIRA